MNTPSAPLLNALRDLRHSLGFTAALVDTIMLGRLSDRTNALRKIEPAIRLLITRTQQALDTLEDQP